MFNPSVPLSFARLRQPKLGGNGMISSRGGSQRLPARRWGRFFDSSFITRQIAEAATGNVRAAMAGDLAGPGMDENG